MKANDPTKDVDVTVLIKLGSIAIHAEEMMSPTGHEFDRIALNGLLNDPEIKTWLAAMDRLAFLPKKRKLRAKRSQ